jgi:hypothetical protein
MKTAVEWLIEQLTEVDYNCVNKTFLQSNNSLAGHKMRELFKQAKEMEKKDTDNKAIHFAEWLTNKHTTTLSTLYAQFEEEHYKENYESNI